MNILHDISIDPIIITFLLLICILVKILNTISSQIQRNNSLMVEILKSNKENNQTEINFTDEENLKSIQNNKYFKEQNKKLNQLQISLNKISGNKKAQNACYSALKSNINDILNKKFENLSKVLNELKMSTKKQRLNLNKTFVKIDKTLQNTEFMGLYGESLTSINDKLNTKSTDQAMLLSILNKTKNKIENLLNSLNEKVMMMKKINEQFKENQLAFDIKASIFSEEMESKLTNRNLLVNTLLSEIINIFYERIYDYDMNKNYFQTHQFNDYFHNTFIKPTLCNKYTVISNLLNQIIKTVNFVEGDKYQLKNEVNCLIFEFEYIDEINRSALNPAITIKETDSDKDLSQCEQVLESIKKW